MRNRTKNKAIKGRRNRVHGQIILKYNEFDQATKMEMDKKLKDWGVRDFKYALVPKCVDVVNLKRSRITDMRGADLADKVSNMAVRMERTEYQVKQLIKDSHPPVDLRDFFLSMLNEVQAVQK